MLLLEYMVPLGSCVHLTPVFAALKQGLGLTVTLATRGLAAQLHRHSPFIDRILQTPDPLTDLRGAVASLRQQIAGLPSAPQCCFTGAGDQRTRIALLGAFACSGWRGGFTVVDSLYQRPLRYDWQHSLIANNLRLAGLAGAPTAHREPQVFFTATDAGKAAALLLPLRAEGRPVLIIVSQNSGGQRTGWHLERWQNVIAHARQTLGYAVAFVGTAADAPAIETLRAACGGVSLAGQTSVTELAALLAQSDMAVSIDTGTMHLGRCVGLPMAVLGPSWQKPLEWLPLDKPQVRILRGADRDGVPANYRLDEIQASAVIAALDELSALYPANSSQRQERVRANLSQIDLLQS